MVAYTLQNCKAKYYEMSYSRFNLAIEILIISASASHFRETDAEVVFRRLARFNAIIMIAYLVIS